jgi:hypothetical protein
MNQARFDSHPRSEDRKDLRDEALRPGTQSPRTMYVDGWEGGWLSDSMLCKGVVAGMSRCPQQQKRGRYSSRDMLQGLFQAQACSNSQ